MNSKTIAITLNVSKEGAFSFLPKPDNLPVWATEFCRELKVSNGKYKVVTCDPESEEFFFKIEADPKTGVIDMFVGPSEGHMGIFPSRVVEMQDGLSIYLFTMLQQTARAKISFRLNTNLFNVK
jgi:hypothetical protein